jgi:ankyrin repeat protein
MEELGERLLGEAGMGNTGRVRTLVGNGANVNFPDEETGDRPLHRAAMEGHVDTARFLNWGRMSTRRTIWARARCIGP